MPFWMMFDTHCSTQNESFPRRLAYKLLLLATHTLEHFSRVDQFATSLRVLVEQLCLFHVVLRRNSHYWQLVHWNTFRESINLLKFQGAAMQWGAIKFGIGHFRTTVEDAVLRRSRLIIRKPKPLQKTNTKNLSCPRCQTTPRNTVSVLW